MNWVQRKACDVVAGDILVRNVRPGFEWVPGPYGAFVVQEVRNHGDEWNIYGADASGVDKEQHQFDYDVEELVWVKPSLN